MDVNQSIVAILESIGVDHIFGGSGQVNASMLLSLKRSDKIKTIIVKNEQAASFMACGYGMFSTKLGVCFATGGPGAFNLFSGMAVAYYDSIPLLGITGYTSKPARGKGALNESTGLNRTPDSHAMFSATTKKSYILEDPRDTCDIFEEAVHIACSNRPGPVHIHIPKDITTAEVPNYRRINNKPDKREAPEEQITAAATYIIDAVKSRQKLMVLAGYGISRAGAEDKVKRFVELTNIPCATTMDGKGVFPEDHPLSIGVYGTSGDPGAATWCAEADGVIAIGNSFAQNATFGFKPDLFSGKKLVHINIDPHEIGKVYPPDYPIQGDAGHALYELNKKIAKGLGRSTDTAQRIPRNKFYDIPVEYSGTKIHPAALVKALSEVLPEKAIVLGDAGAHMLWLSCYLNLTKGQRYQNPGSFGPMASHVNGAIGVKCANPDKVVVSGCGDGGYLMAGFELLTAVQYNIPVIWIIFNNGEFNVIKRFLLNMFSEHAYMEFDNPDYTKYAEACNAIGYRVTTVEEFQHVFQVALGLNKPVLIDAVVENDVYPPFALGKV